MYLLKVPMCLHFVNVVVGAHWLWLDRAMRYSAGQLGQNMLQIVFAKGLQHCLHISEESAEIL